MSTNSPAAAPESHSPSPSKIDRWMPPGVGAAMLASGYVVAWRFFPKGAQGAAMPVNIIAVSMVYVGLLVMAMMGPVAAVAIVKRLPVRSWSAGPKALTVIMAIGVAVASVAAVLHVSGQLLEALWSRWPQ